jgi:hypothetical protein
MKKNLLLLLLFGVIPAGLQVARFHSKKSTVYNVSKKKNDCFHSNRLVPILPCDEKHHFQGNYQELNNAFYFIDFNAEEKRTVVFNKTTFNSNHRKYFWNT